MADEAAATIEKELFQDAIDSLLGMSSSAENKLVKESIERLPMLEVVFDRFVQMLSTSLRRLTSGNVDVRIHSMTSVRFDNYVHSVPVPAILSIYRAIEWENYGLLNFNSSLVFSLIEVLFGGRKFSQPIRIEGRPYTSIEQGMVAQVSEIVLDDLAASFGFLSPVTFEFDRLESNPRFAMIAHPSDMAILLQLRVGMEECGGNLEVVLPLAMLEPIKGLLSQTFVGDTLIMGHKPEDDDIAIVANKMFNHEVNDHNDEEDV